MLPAMPGGSLNLGPLASPTEPLHPSQPGLLFACVSCPLSRMSPHVPPHAATASPEAAPLPALAENRRYCVCGPGEAPTSTRREIKAGCGGTRAGFSPQPRHIEEDCVPLLAPRLRLDVGSESRFPALKLPGCLFSLQPCPLGPGAHWSSKLSWGRSGWPGAGDLPGEGGGGGRGCGTSFSLPGVCARPSGVGWGERWRTSSVTHPQGWKWHSPSCFWLGEDRVPYSDARKTCSDYGSTLVTITNRSVSCWWRDGAVPKQAPQGGV